LTAFQRGFSLAELMITLAIVGILSAIAWPGYNSTIQRAQRNEARFALLQLQHMQERHYAAHFRYADRLGTMPDAQTLATPDQTGSGHYTLSVDATEDGQGYTAIATARPTGAQARDRACQRLSINETGMRRAAAAGGGWTSADPARCWGRTAG
jgi:type IV pilus assembly protein PilE